MPVLPSGRRVEFSLDRFRAMLGMLDPAKAQAIADALQDPDDLLYVLDAVHFARDDGRPFFADYLAADWETSTADWNRADREALRHWFESDTARRYRAEAIEHIKAVTNQIPAAKATLPPAKIARHPSAIAGNTSLAVDFPGISTNTPALARWLH